MEIVGPIRSLLVSSLAYRLRHGSKEPVLLLSRLPFQPNLLQALLVLTGATPNIENPSFRQPKLSWGSARAASPSEACRAISSFLLGPGPFRRKSSPRFV